MVSSELLKKIDDGFLQIREEINAINQITIPAHIDSLVSKGYITKVGERYRVDNSKEVFGGLNQLIKTTTISNKGTFITFCNQAQIDKLSKQLEKTGY